MRNAKNIVISIFITMFSFISNAQQNTFWKVFEDSTGSLFTPFDFLITPFHGYLTGNVGTILKTDSMGNKLFNWYIAGTPFLHCTFHALCTTHDLGSFAAGSFKIVRLDFYSNIMWAKSLNIANAQIGDYFIFAVKETSDHGLLLAGNLQNPTTYSGNILIKTDSAGNVQWSKFYRTTGNGNPSLVSTSDGGFILCGGAISLINIPPQNFADLSIIKVDSSGIPQWAKHHGILGTGYSMGHITSTSDGNYIICGFANTEFLLKIDTTGNTIWKKNYTYSGYSPGKWVEETPDHGFIASGSTFFGPGQTSTVLKTDSVGNLQWATSVGSYFNTYAGGIKPTSDGGYAMVARVPGTINGSGIGIFKMDSAGFTGGCYDAILNPVVSNVTDTVISCPVFDSIINVTTTPIIITPIDLDSIYNLCPLDIKTPQPSYDLILFPNPATTHITLQYHLAQNATLQIHDITGRRVQQATLAKTSTTATIDVRALPEGMYFYSVQGANGGVKAGKFVKE